MNERLIFAIAVGAIVLVAGTFLIVVQQGPTSTVFQSATSTATGNYFVNSSPKLELRLSVNASYTGGSNGNVTVVIRADEYNTLSVYESVSEASQYPLTGLSLGPCGNGAYPFGVALYSGKYSATNVSQATPIKIYAPSACPAIARVITGYVFEPDSDLAEVLPSGANVTVYPMLAQVTATASYASGASSGVSLGPGTYSVAAGDEWGAIVVVYFTIGIATVSTTTSSLGTYGVQLAILSASLAVLPISAEVIARTSSSSARGLRGGIRQRFNPLSQF